VGQSFVNKFHRQPVLAQRRSAAKPQTKSRAGDDACQRMKSANGFFLGEMTHPLEPFIRWRKEVQYPRRKFIVRNTRFFDIAVHAFSQASLGKRGSLAANRQKCSLMLSSAHDNT
jgi:hypothetical protein